MSFFALLRLGNIYRVLVLQMIAVWGTLFVLRAPLWGYGVGTLLALVAALFEAWWIGHRISPTLAQWRRVAQLVGDEDFRPPLDPDVPFAFQPVHASLTEARRHLAERLDNAHSEKALLVSTLDALTDGVVAVDAYARILMVNRAALALFGMPATCAPEDVQGQLLVRLVRDPQLNEMIDRVLSTGRPMRRETEILVTRRSVRLSVAPIVGEGRVKGVVAAISDETTVKQLERVRQDFVANVSHELKTPITAIRGWAEALLDGVSEQSGHREAAVVIHRQSERLGALVDDLMTLAQIDAMPSPHGTETVRVPDLIKEVCASLDESRRHRSISVETNVASDATSVVSRTRPLRYILHNLLDNALKYAPERSTVTIDVHTEEPGVLRLDVRDQGPGIAQALQPRIFERFYRAPVAGGRQEEGYGLGLAIVKNMATTLGGQVSLKSRIGKGSVFSVQIPIEPKPTDPTVE